MEEDILYGKHRHFFGGIAPSNTRWLITVNDGVDTTGANILVFGYAPLDTIIDGQMICCVGGIVIRKSYSDYPKDEFDGELVADITRDEFDGAGNYFAISYKEPPSFSGRVYYRAFPYSKQGVYNRNTTNMGMDYVDIKGDGSNVTRTYLFGYDLDTNNPDPVARVTYPSDVDNYHVNPAYMDYELDEFIPGGWERIIAEQLYFTPRPCMLKYDGTVDYYLDPDDYTRKEYGGTSDVANKSYDGNAMMEWPKIYTKRWEENGIYHFRCSDVKIDEDYECWCNYDANNNEIDHFYTAIYRGTTPTSYSTTRSLSGMGVTRGLSMTAERTRAKNNGAGWDLEVLADHLLIQDLLVLMAKSTDTQTAYGVGRASNSFISTGSANTSGLFSGANNSSKSVKVFGMEDWWGDLSRRILGLTVYSGKLYAKITKGTKDGTSVTDYVIDSVSGYLQRGVTITSASYGYIKTLSTYPWGRLPGTFSGSASTYECDHGQIDYNTHSYMPAEIGGSYAVENPYKGAFGCRFSYTAASQCDWMTSRLSYKPSAK